MSRWLLNGYRFVAIAAPGDLVQAIDARARALGLLGSVLVAHEGINVALSGARPALEDVLGFVTDGIGQPLADLLWTEMPLAGTTGAPLFRRLRVRERAEIVTFGYARPADAEGARDVDAGEWNTLIATPGVRVLDVRNDYEVAVGTFAGAENPHTDSFTAFKDFVQRELAAEPERPIAMFCTGGIRCAKAGAWMREQGFSQLYQLRGGVLGYLASPGVDTSAWQGECFVFDDRGAFPRSAASD